MFMYFRPQPQLQKHHEKNMYFAQPNTGMRYHPQRQNAGKLLTKSQNSNVQEEVKLTNQSLYPALSSTRSKLPLTIDQPQKTTGFLWEHLVLSLDVFGGSSLENLWCFTLSPSSPASLFFFFDLLLLAFPGWRYYYSQYIKIYKFLEVSESNESYNQMNASRV